MKIIERQERGWPGHYICADYCAFRRNTLLTCGEKRIVVSTVGNYRYNGAIHEIEFGRYYETMAFHSDVADQKYYNADVYRQIDFNSPWSIGFKDGDVDANAMEANAMHENVVAEITQRMENGDDL